MIHHRESTPRAVRGHSWLCLPCATHMPPMRGALVALGALLATHMEASSATPEGSCNVIQDVDIDPHTPGMGSLAASDISDCCKTCTSPGWYSKGCRFYTLSKGRCWFKTGNASVVKSPGKLSGHALAQAAPPPPPPPWPVQQPPRPPTPVGNP